MSALTQILSQKALEPQIARFTLVPATGGLFEFSVNGKLLYSKKETRRHAEPGELLNLLKAYLEEN